MHTQMRSYKCEKPECVIGGNTFKDPGSKTSVIRKEHPQHDLRELQSAANSDAECR